MSEIIPPFPKLTDVYLPPIIAEGILNRATNEKEVVELTTHFLRALANEAFGSDVQELLDRIQQEIIEDDEFEDLVLDPTKD